MALFIIFNNFFHDLATGLWMSSVILTITLYRWVKEEQELSITGFYQKILPRLLNLNLISLILIFPFGIIRALAFYEFEFLPAAGKGQILALVIKHIFLLSAGGFGVYWQYKMRSSLKRAHKGDAMVG